MKKAFKQILKFFGYLLCYIAYPFSFLIPRNGKKIAFGCYRGAFCDNSKYLFIELAEKGHDVVWLSTKRSTIRQVRALELPAEWVFSPRGAWRALRSKYWVVSSYTSDIFWTFSGGAQVLNLWHGVGVKRIEYNSLSGPLYDRYIRKTFKEAFFHPESYRKPERLVVGSRELTAMFSSAFRIPEGHCLECGYPRNRMLRADSRQLEDFITRYEPASIVDLCAKLSSFSRVWLYMPTWRESQREIFSQGMDLDAIQSIMKERNELLLLKPHSNTVVEGLDTYSNIMLLDGRMDVYPLLPHTDVLITDYSSILYDYILMKGKSVVLYLYDKQEYLDAHSSYFPFDENTIGQTAGSFTELIDIMRSGPQDINEERRAALIKKFWGEKAFDYKDILDWLP